MFEPPGKICDGWAWDPALRELRHYPRKGKGYAEEPDAVERLEQPRSVTWHRWSQAAMEGPTGEIIGASQSRIIVPYERGGELTIDEPDRECAEKLARAMAESFRLDVQYAGPPSGRTRGNVPQHHEMGPLVHKGKGVTVTLDEVSGEIRVKRRKGFFRSSTTAYSTNDVHRVELRYEVRGPIETYTAEAVIGPEELRVPLAAYQGYEGWADPQEWREFTEELARRLGAEAVVTV
jgi:hypothetical protein